MPRITPLDRVLLMLAVLLASYQVVVGIDGLGSAAVACYTVGFGMLLVAGLLVVILGFEILDSPHIAVMSTIIPLSLSAGLVAEFSPDLRSIYLFVSLAALLLVVITRYFMTGKAALITLAFTHAISGLIIFLLPLLVCLKGQTPLRFGLVSLGGALIGVFGLLLSFQKADRLVLSGEKLWSLFPLVLLGVTGAFVWGFSGL